ncbi:MAG TPA: GNAT family N-acetyltransferase [Anaerolineae bacterium]
MSTSEWPITVRPAMVQDVPAITELYNYYVRTSPISFDIEPVSIQSRLDWFSHYAERGRHRLLVAICGAELLGYAGSSQLRPRPAYDTSVETSIYVHHEHFRSGIASRLYTTLFDLLRDEDVHRAYAGVTLPNEASVALHRKFGFVDLGVYHEVGRKFGRYWDVAWLEKPLQ